MAAATLEGTKVLSADGEHVSKILSIMLDVGRRHIAYAVLAEGGFLGIGATLHAILDSVKHHGRSTGMIAGGYPVMVIAPS